MRQRIIKEANHEEQTNTKLSEEERVQSQIKISEEAQKKRIATSKNKKNENINPLVEGRSVFDLSYFATTGNKASRNVKEKILKLLNTKFYDKYQSNEIYTDVLKLLAVKIEGDTKVPSSLILERALILHDDELYEELKQLLEIMIYEKMANRILRGIKKVVPKSQNKVNKNLNENDSSDLSDLFNELTFKFSDILKKELISTEEYKSLIEILEVFRDLTSNNPTEYVFYQFVCAYINYNKLIEKFSLSESMEKILNSYGVNFRRYFNLIEKLEEKINSIDTFNINFVGLFLKENCQTLVNSLVKNTLSKDNYELVCPYLEALYNFIDHPNATNLASLVYASGKLEANLDHVPDSLKNILNVAKFAMLNPSQNEIELFSLAFKSRFTAEESDGFTKLLNDLIEDPKTHKFAQLYQFIEKQNLKDKSILIYQKLLEIIDEKINTKINAYSETVKTDISLVSNTIADRIKLLAIYESIDDFQKELKDEVNINSPQEENKINQLEALFNKFLRSVQGLKNIPDQSISEKLKKLAGEFAEKICTKLHEKDDLYHLIYKAILVNQINNTFHNQDISINKILIELLTISEKIKNNKLTDYDKYRFKICYRVLDNKKDSDENIKAILLKMEPKMNEFDVDSDKWAEINFNELVTTENNSINEFLITNAQTAMRYFSEQNIDQQNKYTAACDYVKSLETFINQQNKNTLAALITNTERVEKCFYSSSIPCSFQNVINAGKLLFQEENKLKNITLSVMNESTFEPAIQSKLIVLLNDVLSLPTAMTIKKLLQFINSQGIEKECEKLMIFTELSTMIKLNLINYKGLSLASIGHEESSQALVASTTFSSLVEYHSTLPSTLDTLTDRVKLLAVAESAYNLVDEALIKPKVKAETEVKTENPQQSKNTKRMERLHHKYVSAVQDLQTIGDMTLIGKLKELGRKIAALFPSLGNNSNRYFQPPREKKLNQLMQATKSFKL